MVENSTVNQEPIDPLYLMMQERVQAGIQWLNSRDEQFWAGYCEEYDKEREDILNGEWLFGLDLGDLNLQSGSYCVLGQVGGNYEDVINYAYLSQEEASRLGFFLDTEEYLEQYIGTHAGTEEEAELDENNPVPSFFRDQHWSQLTEIWIQEVRELRAKVQELS